MSTTSGKLPTPEKSADTADAARTGRRLDPGRPFLGGEPHAASLELATGDDGVLDDSGRFARVQLGRVRVGEQTVAHVAIKLQRDAYLTGGGDDALLTNDVIDEMWRREVESHRQVRDEHVVGLLAAAGAHDSPPVLHCSHRNAYFHPPCPRTGQLLRVCRDDRALQDAGLHPYRTTLHRYLAGGDGNRVFYKRGQLEDERPRPDVVVRIGDDLIADLAPLVHASTPTDAWFPCQTCPAREACFGAAGAPELAMAAQRLRFVSFYDFAYLVMPAQPLGFEEACALAGGADWRDLLAQVGSPLGARVRLLEDAAARLARGRQWLTPRSEQPAFALELLRTKLDLLHDVAAGLAAVHRACGRAHLGVEPANVVVDLLPSHDSVPTRWGLSARLIDLGAARRFLPAHASRRDVPVRFVPDGHRDYRAPAARSPEGEMALAQVQVERSADPEVRALTLQARFPTDLDVRDYAPGDLARVMLTPDVWVWAEVSALSEQTVTLSVPAPKAPAATMLAARREFAAQVWLLRTFGPECDMYGLGMLLFRALLANDAMPGSRVQDLVARIAERLAADVEERRLGPAACRAFVARKLREHADVFTDSALAWREADRTVHTFGLPHDLWHDLLMFGFRLLSTAPGFGFGVRSGAEATPVAERARGELHTLLARVHTELFGRASRDRELTGVFRNLLKQVRDDMLRSELSRFNDQQSAT